MSKGDPNWHIPLIEGKKTWLERYASLSDHEKAAVIRSLMAVIIAFVGLVGLCIVQFLKASKVPELQHMILSLKTDVGKPTVEYGKIACLTALDLDNFTQSNKCSGLDRSLDDRILTNYFVIPLMFRNNSQNPIDKASFDVSLGTTYAKIIDVQHVVRAPKAKNLVIRHNLPKWKWHWPTNVMIWSFYWESAPATTVSFYFSMAPDRGFGKITPTPVSGNRWQFKFAGNTEPIHWYFKFCGEDSFYGENPPFLDVSMPNPTF